MNNRKNENNINNGIGKKILNILFWVAFFVLLLLTLRALYNRLTPAKMERIKQPITTGQSEEHTEGNDTDEEKTEEGKTDENNSEENYNEEPIMAPDFTLEDVEGNTVSLFDFRGKIVFLNFWATWCPYCVDEMPDLESANKKLAEKGDAIILTINVQEKLDEVKKYMEDNDLALPVLMDITGEVSYIYSVSGIPVTYVIDKDGAAYGRIGGPTDEETILRIVEDMTKE